MPPGLGARSALHRPRRAQDDVRDLGPARQRQRGQGHRRHVLGLQQGVGVAPPALGREHGVLHGRVRAPGEHAEHAQPVGVDLLAQHIHRRAQGVLGRDVGARARGRPQRGGGVEEHDLPARRAQGRQAGGGQQHRRADVHRLQRRPVRGGGALHRPVAVRAGAVDQHVQRGRQRRGDGGQALRRADIGRQRARRAARLLHLGHCLPQRRFPSADEQDRHALRREQPRDGPADAGAGARDEGGPAA